MVNINRCITDFTYFCANCCKIGDIPFELYGYQKRFIEEIENHRFVIAKKRRAEGFTILSSTWLLWKCMFNPNRSDVILSPSYPMAIHTMEKILKMIDSMPSYMRPKIKVEGKHKLIIEDMESCLISRIPEYVKGRAITHLFIDEAAFIRNMGRHWRAIHPCLSLGGSCHVISTPNETTNWFHEVYNGATNRGNGFHVWRKAWPTKAAKIDWKTEGF